MPLRFFVVGRLSALGHVVACVDDEVNVDFIVLIELIFAVLVQVPTGKRIGIREYRALSADRQVLRMRIKRYVGSTGLIGVPPFDIRAVRVCDLVHTTQAVAVAAARFLRGK